MKTSNTTPTREELRTEDTWDLRSLFASDDAWDSELQALNASKDDISKYRGRLGESLDVFLEAHDLLFSFEERIEAIVAYAELSRSENLEDPRRVERAEQAMLLYTEWSSASSFFTPELIALPEARVEEYLQDKRTQVYRRPIILQQRQKKYVLSDAEEKLLAMQQQYSHTAQKAFSVLTNVDMQFGTIEVDGQQMDLTQSSLRFLLENTDREVRKKSYFQFYKEFEAHKNTLSSLYTGSVQHDVYLAKIRNYPSSRMSSLYGDDISESVYDTLIERIHDALPDLHRYYELRKKMLGVEKLCHYDVHVPLLSDVDVEYPFDDAVDVMLKACAPLGEEYCSILQKGIQDRWIDRYESKGKRSGAFSWSTYNSYPYILLNYRSEGIDSLFTLLHEAGHSMHSYLASKHNTYVEHQYTIFEAEIASTLNEMLLSHYLEYNNPSTSMLAYLLNNKIDNFVGTMFRQTMFAEFEHIVHTHAEQGGSLSLEYFTNTYKDLLQLYFGDIVELPDCASLECLRVPHFYSAFYVYKYATGIAASTCFAQELLQTGDNDPFLSFLKRGGRDFPLTNLGMSGVTVDRALDEATKLFRETLNRFESIALEK